MSFVTVSVKSYMEILIPMFKLSTVSTVVSWPRTMGSQAAKKKDWESSSSGTARAAGAVAPSRSVPPVTARP